MKCTLGDTLLDLKKKKLPYMYVHFNINYFKAFLKL